MSAAGAVDEKKSPPGELSARWRESLSAVTTGLALENVFNEEKFATASEIAASQAKTVGKTLSMLAQPFRRRVETTPKVSDEDWIATLDLDALNEKARVEIAASRRFGGEVAMDPADRAAWAFALLLAHALLLVVLLGRETAERLAWPLIFAAPTAWFLSTTTAREDEKSPAAAAAIPVARSGPPVFKTLGMLSAEKKRSKVSHKRGSAVAGQSLKRARSEGEPMTWEPADPSLFFLRGPNYLKDKKKQPSPPALYECFGSDILRSYRPVFDFPARVKLPDKRPHEKNLPRWLPRILVQTMFFPGTPPPLVGKPPPTPPTDGPKGYQVVVYWRIREDAAKIAAEEDDEDSWPPHLKLWKQYAQLADTMPVLNGCLKGVASVHNLDDKNLGLPRLVKQYNAKPVLMAASALVGERPGVVKISRDDDYFEFALDVGTDFAAMSNHALSSMRSQFPKLILNLGWLVEARTPDVLPEGLIACCRINKVDLNLAVDVDDFLDGTNHHENSNNNNTTTHRRNRSR